MRSILLCAACAALALPVMTAAQPLPGERFTPPARGERHADKLQVGATAPDFTLPAADGEQEMALARWRGKQPVVLIFGSCT